MSIVTIYVRLIREGLRTLESIPETVRADVQAVLAEGAAV